MNEFYLITLENMNILDDKSTILDHKTKTLIPYELEEEDVRIFVGDQKKAYYVATWQEQKDEAIKVSFNAGAFLAGIFWLAYRRMNGLTLKMTYLLTLIVLIQRSFELSALFSIGGGIAMFVYLGLFGNWHYFRYLEKMTQAIKEKQMDRDFEIQALEKKGNSKALNIPVLFFFVLFLAVLVLGISTFLLRFPIEFRAVILVFMLLGVELTSRTYDFMGEKE